MSTELQDIKKLLEQLPTDTSIEDVQYHLYVLEKIRKGQKDINDGRRFSHQQVRERLDKWLNP